jgi:2'-5' RNA ligase
MESALAVVVDETNSAVLDVRRRFDPYSHIGVPPHITVLYPFIEPSRIDEAVKDRIANAAKDRAAFEFRLMDIEAFPDAVYLAPEPAKTFVQLTQRLADEFPDYPPFGGEFETIIPHLTVGWQSIGSPRDEIERQLRPVLPLDCVAREITLLVEEDDGWSRAETFALPRR